jgi:guanylate kinase
MSKIIKQKERGSLIVMSGPSGCGKGTVIQEFLKKHKDAWLSISCTSRNTRPGDVPNETYYFITREEFEEKIKNEEFLEYAEVYGNYYGTPRKFVMDQLNAGKDVLLEIDIQGALQVKEHFPDGVFVFITPPSLDELCARIYKRGTDSEEVIQRRMASAADELTYASKYDYIIVNDIAEKATKKVLTLMEAERYRVARTYFIIDEICKLNFKNKE